MSWKTKLLPSEATLMQEIVDQVPEEHGARDAFVGILDKLAESDKPKFRYLIGYADSGEGLGTNDDEKAREYASNSANFVFDLQMDRWMVDEDVNHDSVIEEAQ